MILLYTFLHSFTTNPVFCNHLHYTSTSIELLIWIKNTVGNGNIINKKNYKPKIHKDCYSYVIKYNNAINLLDEIYPYLIIESKKKRANLILTKYKEVTPRNGRYTDDMLKAKNQFYLDFMNIS